MSRITSGKMRLDVQPVEPATFIEAALETVRPAADAKGIPLSKLLDPAAGPVIGRSEPAAAGRLEPAVQRDQVHAERTDAFRSCCERVSSHVEITVADTGIGIKPEFLPHVFDRFRQADASATRTAKGLGLGLSIVKHLVELHGGAVRVDEPGGGTRGDVLRSAPAHGRSQEDRARRTHSPQGHRRHRHRLQAVGPVRREGARGRRSGGCARPDPAGPGTSATRGSSPPARPPRPSGGRNRATRRAGERHRHAGRRRIRAPEKDAGARACQGRAAARDRPHRLCPLRGPHAGAARRLPGPCLEARRARRARRHGGERRRANRRAIGAIVPMDTLDPATTTRRRGPSGTAAWSARWARRG